MLAEGKINVALFFLFFPGIKAWTSNCKQHILFLLFHALIGGKLAGHHVSFLLHCTYGSMRSVGRLGNGGALGGTKGIDFFLLFNVACEMTAICKFSE